MSSAMSRFRAMAMRITVHCAIVELCSLRWSAAVFCLICKPTKTKDRITPTAATNCEIATIASQFI